MSFGLRTMLGVVVDFSLGIGGGKGITWRVHVVMTLCLDEHGFLLRAWLCVWWL